LLSDSTIADNPLRALDIADDQIQAVRAVSNPDKLQHLEGLPPNA
jgi:hypothetical protein